MHTRLAILLCLFICQVKGQVNLVPNPGFEEYYQIPCDIGPTINFCKYWGNPTGGSPDYFSTFANPEPTICYTSIPQNAFGYQDAYNGEFYAGIYLYNKQYFEAVEYLESKLTEPLLPKRYCVEFYVSLADSYSAYSLNNFGVYFNSDTIKTNQVVRLNYTPQVVSNVAILSKTEWLKVSGTFLAQGGEQFMVIGNFNQVGNDDTTFVGNVFPIQSEYSYIYIDNVSVYACSGVGVDEKLKEEIKIYPNPAQDFVSIDMPSNYQNPQLSIYNLTGQLVARKQITANQQIPISELGNGMYIFVIQSGDKVIGRQRVVVAR
jgi:Secretion system C-terminal sorting domain